VIDKRLTEEEKKKIKPANQGGGPNYLGEQETVTVPKKWLSDPDHVVAELAYITPREQKILLDANIYGSLKGKPNKGPGGIMSLQGDLGGFDASPGGPDSESGDGSGGRNDKARAADIMTGRVNVTSPTGMTQGYTGPNPTGRNTAGDFFGQPSFLGKVTSGIKDYITGGGLIGAGIRGITGLVNKFTGPKATEYGNLDIPGYNMLNIAGPVVGPTPTEGGDGGDLQGIMATYTPNMLDTAKDDVTDGEMDTSMSDFLQRFRVKNPYRQDKEGQLDPAIIEMINKLYT